LYTAEGRVRAAGEFAKTNPPLPVAGSGAHDHVHVRDGWRRDRLAHAARRKAGLLDLAARYEAEGRREVAGELRAVVGRVDADRPLGGVLPAVEHLTGGATDTAAETPRPALPARGAKMK
jgi:hypothetical protein